MSWSMRDPFTRCLFAPEGDGAGGGAGTGDGAGAGTGTGDGAGAGAGTDDDAGAGWLDGLPEDLRGHPEITKFAGKGIDELAREHVNAQGLIGRKGVVVPKDDATPEDWDKFHAQLGRPDKPEGYEFKMPAGRDPTDADKAFQGKMGGVFHKAGVPARMAAQLNEGWNEYTAGLEKARDDTAAATASETTAALEKEWGKDAAANFDLANREVRAAFGVKDEDLRKAGNLRFEDGRFLLDVVPLAKVFAELGRLKAEAGLIGDGGGGGDAMSTPAAAKAEIARIRAASAEDEKHPLYNKKHPEHEAMNARMDQLYKVAHPEEGGTA